MSSPNGVGKVFNLSGGKTVTSFNGRTGAVRPRAGDYTAADVGALAAGGTAAAATKLATSRTIRTNLASTSTASFNGTANVTPGVTGTLGIANGGTGSTTAAVALANLGADSRYLKLSGGDMTGMLDMNDNVLTGIKTPVSPTDAVSYQFMMDTILKFICTETTVIFHSSSSSYSNYEFTIDLDVVTTTGDLAVFSMNKTINIPSNSAGYNGAEIKIPSAFKNPGSDWSMIGYIGPEITLDSVKHYLYPKGSNGSVYTTDSFTNLFFSGTAAISGNLIVKFK